jgi:DNA-binding NtrC family response regulator
MNVGRILFVDDDESILALIRRSLRKHFYIETATSGAAGLELLKQAEMFSVVVSDLQMPGMNGLEFLGNAREVSPDSVRVLLSGEADLESLGVAVNSAGIFQFLSKPCPPDDLKKALDEAVGHHRIMADQKELFCSTVRASVRALVDVVAMATPDLFKRCTEIRQLVGRLAGELKVNCACPQTSRLVVELSGFSGPRSSLVLTDNAARDWSRRIPAARMLTTAA